HFQYSYFSLDIAPFDTAGYLVDGLFSPLTQNSGDSGSVSFAIAAGHTFGFRVATLDNLGEPGILTVSGFSAPSGPTNAVPEPGNWLVAGAALALLAARYRRSARQVQEERA